VLQKRIPAPFVLLCSAQAGSQLDYVAGAAELHR
jgi:hypothetical protein